MTPLDNVLSRLDKVKAVGMRKDGRVYRACCPSHDDRSPSLSVTETPEGSVLLHCWVGCDAHQITSALGLEMHDLFPHTPKMYSAGHGRLPYTSMDILHGLAKPLLAATLIITSASKRKELVTPQEAITLQEAFGLLNNALEGTRHHG